MPSGTHDAWASVEWKKHEGILILLCDALWVNPAVGIKFLSVVPP